MAKKELTITGAVSSISIYNHSSYKNMADEFSIILIPDNDQRKKIVITYRSEDPGMLGYLYQTLNSMHFFCNKIRELDRANINRKLRLELSAKRESKLGMIAYEGVGLPKILNRFYQEF